MARAVVPVRDTGPAAAWRRRTPALLVVISGPSGVGKDTVIAALRGLPAGTGLARVTTATTRAPRHYEIDGHHYHFLTRERFAALEATGGFLEAATIYGDRYGTPADAVTETLAAGRDVLLAVDVQGAAAVRALYPDALLVFLQPPSYEALAARLRGRGTEDEAALERRLAVAREELAHAGEFDHVVTNTGGHAEQAARKIAALIEGARTGGHRRLA